MLRDRWRLDELTGVDSCVAVYAATHRIGKRVAIRMLHPELSRNAEAKRRFIEEGYAATRVGHPGIASILDDDVAEDGAVYLVSELFEGETLEARIAERGPVTPLELLSLMDGLLDVIVAVHANGISVGRLEPDNVLVTRTGAVKLLDLRPGSQRFDATKDLRAIGAMMSWALTSLRETAAHLPEPLIELVDRALGVDASHGWSDAGEMQSAVREVRALLHDQGDRALSPMSCSAITISAKPARERPQTVAKDDSRSPSTLQRTIRTALVVVGALLGSGVAWLSSVHRPEMGKSAPAVLVSPVQPEPSCSSGSEDNAIAKPLDSVCEPRTRSRAVLRSRPKVVTRPATDDAPPSSTLTPEAMLAERLPRLDRTDLLDRRK
jgi:hypothetical protein